MIHILHDDQFQQMVAHDQVLAVICGFKQGIGVGQGTIEVLIKIQRADPVFILLVKTDKPMKVIDFDGLKIAV